MRHFKAFLLAGVVASAAPQWAMAAAAPAPTPGHNDFHVDYPTCTGSSKRAYGDSSSHDASCAIRQTIYNIRDLRDGYVHEINGYQKQQTFFDSSIIGLGIGSVAAAFSRSPLGWVGGLGIAAAGLGQYRNYYNPEGVGSAYIRAVRGARCVASTAEPLMNAQPGNVWRAIATLRKAIEDYDVASTRLASAPPTAGSADAQVANYVTDAGKKARDAAQQMLQALQIEAGAYNNAPAAIDQANDSLRNYVDLAKHRGRSPDFGDVAAAVNNGIDAEKTVVAATLTARTQLLDAITNKAKADQAAGVPADAAPKAQDPKSLNDAEDGALKDDGDGKDKAGSAGGAPAPGGPADAKVVNAQGKVVTPTPEERSARVAVLGARGKLSALITAVTDAQTRLPTPAFTMISRQIGDCVAGLN